MKLLIDNSVASQFFSFACIGIVATACHYLVMVMLVHFFDIFAVAASGVGFVLGAFVNYILNYHITFKSGKRHYEAMVKFFIIAFVGLSLNTFIMWILLKNILLHYLVAQVVATILVLIWNFGGNRLWTFREG